MKKPFTARTQASRNAGYFKFGGPMVGVRVSTVTGEIDADLARHFRVYAAAKGMAQSDVMEAALRDYLPATVSVRSSKPR